MEIWRKQRYERILVDFLFRTRCFETAQALAKATGIEVCALFDLESIAKESLYEEKVNDT